MSASHTINRKRKQNKAKQKNFWLNNFVKNILSGKKISQSTFPIIRFIISTKYM